MVEIPQSVEQMTRAVGVTHEDVKARRITHDGDERFSNHILAAVARYNDRGFTLSKSKSRAHIDAAVSTCLSHDRAIRHEQSNVTRTYSDEEFESLFHYT